MRTSGQVQAVPRQSNFETINEGSKAQYFRAASPPQLDLTFS